MSRFMTLIALCLCGCSVTGRVSVGRRDTDPPHRLAARDLPGTLRAEMEFTHQF